MSTSAVSTQPHLYPPRPAGDTHGIITPSVTPPVNYGTYTYALSDGTVVEPWDVEALHSAASSSAAYPHQTPSTPYVGHLRSDMSELPPEFKPSRAQVPTPLMTTPYGSGHHLYAESSLGGTPSEYYYHPSETVPSHEARQSGSYTTASHAGYPHYPYPDPHGYAAQYTTPLSWEARYPVAHTHVGAYDPRVKPLRSGRGGEAFVSGIAHGTMPSGEYSNRATGRGSHYYSRTHYPESKQSTGGGGGRRAASTGATHAPRGRYDRERKPLAEQLSASTPVNFPPPPGSPMGSLTATGVSFEPNSQTTPPGVTVAPVVPTIITSASAGSTRPILPT